MGPAREPRPWTRRFLWGVHAVGWAWWLGSTLVFLVSLWLHDQYGTLGLLGVSCAAYYAAFRFGRPEWAGRRFIAVTVLVVVGVVFLQRL
jgi:uncharacterized membrane protein YccC